MYIDTRNGNACLSLGFRRWAALGAPLQKVSCGGKDDLSDPASFISYKIIIGGG